LNQPVFELARRRLEDSLAVKRAMLESECVRQVSAAAAAMIGALRADGKILFFGNGGSAMDAGHLAAELAGRFYRDRPGLPAVSLADGTAALTAIANDYAYDDVFARQVRALGRPGDVAVGLTTSGNSRNVIEAIITARQAGLFTVVLTGRSGGQVAERADICIRVPTNDTPRVQEACLHLGHTICEIIENEMFPDDLVSRYRMSLQPEASPVAG
jgi:D-sedoheptulose 7-phosphate isomerase